MIEPASSEFTRPLRLDEIGAGGKTFSIEAGAAEREALARRFGLVSVDKLTAEGMVARVGSDDRYRLDARLCASVVQTCVVTLGPVSAHVESAFNRLYDRAASPEWADDTSETFLDGGEEPVVEPIIGDVLDIGEVVAEQLALELDPFPRAVGASFHGYESGEEFEPQPSEQANPFAVLAAMRRTPESNR